MSIDVLGISGSPIKNSNTDRLIKAVLDEAGLKSEFVKLSDINVRPCYACKKCVPDNVCKIKDDFPELAEKIKTSKALIIGAYSPYGQTDGFTKALLERFWSLRHVNNLLKGKVCATIMTCLVPEIMNQVNQSLAAELRDYEHMDLIGQLTVQGNLPCIFCGKGDECEMSGLKMLYGPEVRTSSYGYTQVEDQKEVWEEAIKIGRLIRERLQN